MIMSESYLKSKILTSGVIFSQSALEYAIRCNAKGQNLVYNAPACLEGYRPQELKLIHSDGYETVVSCVAPCTDEPVFINVEDNELVAVIEGEKVKDVSVEYIIEPEYYSIKLSNQHIAKEYVSACGYDELNILPWLGCAISKCCLFCGTNTVEKMNNSNALTAFNVSRQNAWEKSRVEYLNSLREAIRIAKKSECYKEHMHVIIISGDLCDDRLDDQAKIYSEIARAIKEDVEEATEGIVAVMMPPQNPQLLSELYVSGIRKIVFNLEVGDERLFHKYCPGKANIGYKHIINSLYEAVTVFGKNNVWTNFVLGLEPTDKLLKLNEDLAKRGIVSSANVLHIDKGNRLDCSVPDYDTVTHYFYEQACILKKYDQKPFYCSKALRTSLSNEAYDGRIIL